MGVGAIRFVVAGLLLLVATACTKKNPALCDSDEDCKDPASPFCDIAGEYPESDNIAHSCSATPASCPIERCGCEVGAGLSCDLDQLTVCNADGHSTSTLTCGFGCSTEDRCLTFEPSNGLGPALMEAIAEPDILIPSGAHIDTELGLVQDASGMPIEIKSIVVPQAGGPSIRAFLGRSFVIDDLVVAGSHVIAFVSPGRISVIGRFDASANAGERGPAGQDSPAVCVGGAGQERPGCTIGCSAVGGGGGGNATAGGAGGDFGNATVQGGTVVIGFVPLVGGCRGGAVSFNDGTIGTGGGGGGAVQLVSLEEIALTNTGLIDLGGGGGQRGSGGGSGGSLILEAPRVRLDGATAGIATNGGAGAACSSAGPDANPNNLPAYAPVCATSSGGNGGAGTVMAQRGELACEGQLCAADSYQGGGGGSVGRVRIATKDGTYESVANPVMSVVITAATLTAR